MSCRRFIWLYPTILLLAPIQLLSQENAPITFFYEIIKDDSVVMFFNERNHFIDKECADYKRYIRVNSNGDFNSYFEDVTKDNLLTGKGRYVHGKKYGRFETYYPNGKLKVKGYYTNNRPVEQWDYFYENGLPERTLKFTATDTLLIRFVDPKGDVIVAEGNGEFKGFVAGLSKSDNLIAAKGKIVNGKPHGKWSSTISNGPYCKEEFDNGKLIRGTFPNAQSDKSYNYPSHLNTFILGNYFEFLEQYRTERCADSAKYVSSKK